MAALLLAGGCRRPTPGFWAKAGVPASSIERAVLFATLPGSKADGFFETRNPKLVARLVEGLRSASRPGSVVGAEEATKEAVSRLYLVPRTGAPLFFGVMVDRAEAHYGRDLADALAELLKEKPVPLSDAYDSGRKDLTDLHRRAQ